MLKFIRAGMYTSVQDGGREGQRQWGISRCGALDKPAMTIANLLVGNAPEAAALEITLGQVDVQFTRHCWFALTGAACEATLDGAPVWLGWRMEAKAGQRLVLKNPQPGPEYHEFDSVSQESFWRSPWKLSPQSNRMGYRLQGQPLRRTTDREMLSHGLLPGVVQVPHNGQPIVLMNDAQTTGGYPRIACIIEADMYQLAQIPLGQPIHFVPCSLEEALKARADQQRYLEQLAWRLSDEN